MVQLSFEELYRRKHPKEGDRPPEHLLALDPGETTGWAWFRGLILESWGEINTSDMGTAPRALQSWILRGKPSEIICENYKVYAWKAKDHSWASLHTPRLIGAIETICQLAEPEIPLRKRMAQAPKGFVTDERLRAWGFYVPKKHARDAIRHACYHILFPGEP